MNEIAGLLESGDSPVSPLFSPRSLGHRYVLLCLALCWFPSLNLGPYPCVTDTLSTEPLPQPTSQNSTYPFKPPHSLPYSEDAIAYLKVQCVFLNVCTCMCLHVCECVGTSPKVDIRWFPQWLSTLFFTIGSLSESRLLGWIAHSRDSPASAQDYSHSAWLFT